MKQCHPERAQRVEGPAPRVVRLLVACATFAFASVDAEAQTTSVARIDWPAFLGRHDLVWNHLPARWGESAFIGNGNLGATIFMRDSALSWTINQTDIVVQSSRFPIGRVKLVTKGAQRSGNARLVLWDAEAHGEVVTDSGSVLWRSYASTTPSVIVIELEGRGGERSADLSWLPDQARPPRKVARKEVFAPEDLHPDAIVRTTRMNTSSVQTFIGGGAHAEWIRRGSKTAGKETFYVTIGKGNTGDEALGSARRAVNVAESFGAKKMLAQHRSVWRAYYPSSFLSFPDPRLEGYYWIQIYKLGSAMNYADKLKGRLLIYYGTADNNVHPNNAMQLIKALQAAGKSFEVQVGPDAGHSGVNNQRMMEFFIENLVMKNPIS